MAKVGGSSNRGSKPGERRGGRRKGTPNKVNATVKMMVLGALDAKGGQKWLEGQMDENPQSFLTLLGKIMPTQVVGDVSHRFVALMPPPEGAPDEWLRKYSPTYARRP